MNDIEVIDAHFHLQKNLAEEKEVLSVISRRDRDRYGNPEAIMDYMDRQGISKVLCLIPFPTKPLINFLLSRMSAIISKKELSIAEKQVEKDTLSKLKQDNEWLCQVSKKNQRIFVGIGIQNLFTPKEMVEEVEQRVAQGAKAVKLVPGVYSHFPNDHAFWPMYSKCEELGIPIISDTGTLSITGSKNRDFPKIYYGEPIHFTEVLESFPRLTLVMCHLASAFWDERVEMAQRYKNLYFDVSGGFNPPDKVLTNSPLVARDGRRAAAEEDAVRIIRKVGPHRIIFGSDGPGIMVQPAIEQILRLSLTDEEKRMILSENAKRIYRI